MCGRIDVSGDPFSRTVSDRFGIVFSATENRDLRPTHAVSTVSAENGRYRQRDLIWGIKPAWAKRLLINAKADDGIAKKNTFKRAFYEARCLVPCSGWYEWRSEGGPKKQRYWFTADEPLYMAGIYFSDPSAAKLLVTLTTAPTAKASEIHDRMPLILADEHLDLWLSGEPHEVEQLLLHPVADDRLRIVPV